MIHDLKCWPEFFEPLSDGRKRFEIRKEDDRVFCVGDTLRLREWDKVSGYTGRQVDMDVTFILGREPWVPTGYVCMSLVPSNAPREVRAVARNLHAVVRALD